MKNYILIENQQDTAILPFDKIIFVKSDKKAIPNKIKLTIGLGTSIYEGDWLIDFYDNFQKAYLEWLENKKD